MNILVLFAIPVYGELYGTGLFEEMSISTDEDEHSIEMHLPYIAKIMERFLKSLFLCPHFVEQTQP